MQSIGNDMFGGNPGTYLFVLHHRLLKAANNFIPYLQEYFLKYKPSQKLVVLRMLQRMSIHDESLFTNFTNEITSLLSKHSGDDLSRKLNQICIT
jgi:hypothetical protein